MTAHRHKVKCKPMNCHLGSNRSLALYTTVSVCSSYCLWQQSVLYYGTAALQWLALIQQLNTCIYMQESCSSPETQKALLLLRWRCLWLCQWNHNWHWHSRQSLVCPSVSQSIKVKVCNHPCPNCLAGMAWTVWPYGASLVANCCQLLPAQGNIHSTCQNPLEHWVNWENVRLANSKQKHSSCTFVTNQTRTVANIETGCIQLETVSGLQL